VVSSIQTKKLFSNSPNHRDLPKWLDGAHAALDFEWEYGLDCVHPKWMQEGFLYGRSS
jgi:hypothetical protein